MRLARKKVGDLSINLRGEEDVFLLRTTNEYGDPLDLVSEFQRLVVRHAAEDDAQSLSQQISELLHEDHADTLQQKAAAKKFSLSVLRRTREIQLKRSASMERSFDENALESVSLSAENSTVQADSEAPRPLHPVMLPAAPPREAAPAQRRPNRGPPSPPPFSSAATTHGRLSPFVEAASLSTPLEDTLSNTSRPRIEQDAALQAEAQTRRELTRVMAEVVQLCISACRRATAAETALRVMSHTMSSTHTSSSLQNSVLGVGHMAPSPTVRRRTLQPDEATAQSSDLPPPLAPLFGGLSASRRASTPHVISEAVSAELQSGSYCNSIAKTSQARMGEDELGTPQLNQYLLLSELGSGSQGKVMLGFDTKTNQMRAIKMIPRPQLNAASIVKRTDGTRQFARLQREIAIMKRCRHKNVVALYEVIDDEQASMMYLVMQYVEKGPIGKQHTDGTTTPITPSLLANYARQLCAGLHYLHDRGVIHRDIKPENILLDANDHVYLSDFGISSFDSDSASGSFMAIASSAQQSPLRHRNSVQQRGTFAFLAPELLRLDASSQSIKTMEASGQSSATTVDFSGGSAFSAELVDVWALGMTLYILLYGRPPWELSSMYTYVKCILDAPIEYPALVTPPGAEPYYIDFADDWRDLLQGMLCRDERNRLTALQAHSKARALHRRYEEEAPTPHIAPVHGQEIDVTEQDLCLALTATFRHQ